MSQPESSGGPAQDGDVLRVYVYGVVIGAVLFGGAILYLQNANESMRTTVRSARRGMDDMAKAKGEIKAMLDVFEKNKEDEAREQPITWFTTIYKRKGIEKEQIQLGAWKVPPAVGPDGSSIEERYELKFQQKAPVTRQQVAALIHEIERSSTRMRVIELSLQRAGKDEEIETDAWSGNVMVGYRRPKMNDSGAKN